MRIEEKERKERKRKKGKKGRKERKERQQRKQRKARKPQRQRWRGGGRFFFFFKKDNNRQISHSCTKPTPTRREKTLGDHTFPFASNSRQNGFISIR
jgi:hypothetical protein